MADGSSCYQQLRGGLYRLLPMLALPLGLLDWQEGADPGTDGRYFFAPVAWLEAAVREPDSARQILLHSVLHAMLGHPWGRHGRDPDLWSLACDMTVEFLRFRLLGQPLTGVVGKAFYACLEGTTGSATAIYDQLEQGFPLDIDTIRPVFQHDSHTPWIAAMRETLLPGGGEGEGLHALWARQGQKLQPFLQPEKPKIGTGTGSAHLELPELPENHVRFARLLQSFAVMQENRHVNDADFSYSWYAYGLEHCGLPLIEPLEYSEERKLQEMVIVLDTSASCSRGMTGWFLSAVRSILLREQLFFSHFRLHILQCDCKVQQDTRITDLDEFQWYLDHLELYGGGGTDFRPAFRHIDQLVSCGELPRLGGVLYFTDGYGVFPERPPDYPTAFVMLQYRYDDINLPSWAIRLVLDAKKPGRDEGWI